MRKSVPVATQYLFSVYLLGLCFFIAYRLLLIGVCFRQFAAAPGAPWLMTRSIFMGWRFDTAVSGYLLALPALALLISEVAGVVHRYLLGALHLYLGVVYWVALFICSADIPFFVNYGNRINITILNWSSSPMFMFKMVLQDKGFLGYFLLSLLAGVLHIALLRKIYRTFKPQFSALSARPPRRLAKTGYTLLFLGLLFLGIRGRTDEKSPMVPGTAYFCGYNAYNQAGLNPVFTFVWSYLDGMKDENKLLQLIDNQTALANVRRWLHASAADSSLRRSVAATKRQNNYNVILVLMESMSANYMTRHGNTQALTPNLDTLDSRSTTFTNYYSAGIHTFNGVFSTLYGYPALMAQHTMEGTVIPAYSGLPGFFAARGYQNWYFTTHDDQFDNIGGFLRANYITNIVSQTDYPFSKVQSALGISDHDMFDFSLPYINKLHVSGKPFFAVYMTSTNHNPYLTPTNIPFTPKHKDIRGGCVEYADWAIGRFMKMAATEPWFDSTVFVFIGDHGTYDGPPAYGSLPLCYNHVPCIVYAPRLLPAHTYNTPGGQIDLFPTLAGVLGGAYDNNTMGVDLINEGRQWMYFSQDDKIGVADTSSIYVWQKNGPEYFFDLTSRQDLLPTHRAKADSMKTYAFSMVQAAQWLRANKKTGK